jgi:CRISPR/Cas system Type II protein with McrA/HNH and RuvC-like nuclease domain
MKATSASADQAAILEIYHLAKEIEQGLADCINTDDPLSIKMHVDHIIPLSAGGAHSPENLRIISARENLEKGAKI